MEPHTELAIESKLVVRTIAATDVFIYYEGTRVMLDQDLSDNLALLELTTVTSSKHRSYQ